MKVSKGKGVINDIIFILDNIYLGQFFFHALKLLRESLLLSVITHQSEVWFNVTEKDLKELESLDSLLLSQALRTNSKTSQCMMHLELGLEPIRYTIKKRRILYLHHLLTNGKEKLAAHVLREQMKTPYRGDFAQICSTDLKELELDIEEIRLMTKNELKKKLKEVISDAAFKYLRKIKDQQSKGKEIHYQKFEIQKYLTSESQLSLTNMRRIFQLRTRNLPMKRNFPNKHTDLSCVVPECDKEDSQAELFKCPYLEPKNAIGQIGVTYEDLFSNSVEKQVLVTRIIYEKYKSREKYVSSCQEDPVGS